MPERLRTQAYEDRPSSKLGVMDYVKNSVIYILMPVIGLGVGLASRKGTGLSILNQPYQGWATIFRSASQRESLIKAANAAKTYIPRVGEVWGFGAGGFYGAYKLWVNGTKAQLDISQVRDAVEQLRPMESTNDYLKRENAQLRQQLAFGERPPHAGAHTQRLASESAQNADLQR